MILGIIAVSIAWMPFIVVRRRDLCVPRDVARRHRTRALTPAAAPDSGFAIAGLATGALGGALCVVGVIFSVAVVDAVERYENPAEHEATVTSCELDGSTAASMGEIVNLDDDDGGLHGADRVRSRRARTTHIDRRAPFVDDRGAG